MVNMHSIINEIKSLDYYVNAMKKHENRALQLQDLNNLLMHICNLKKWAGIDETSEKQALNIGGVIKSVCFKQNCLKHQITNTCAKGDYKCMFRITDL